MGANRLQGTGLRQHDTLPVRVFWFIPGVEYEKLGRERKVRRPYTPLSAMQVCVGEIRQFCWLQACPEQGRRNEGQSLTRAATS
jgi:hypothetical protein